MYTLIGADGEPYRSREPGALGGHSRSRIYGRLDCQAALRALERRGPYATHRVFFADEVTASAAGYRPCGRCMPSAYAAWKQLTARVGERRYREACNWAWRTAPGSGRRCSIRAGWPDDLETVPHELADLWYAPTPIAKRLWLALRIYRAMPCYANTIHLVGFHSEYGPSDRARLWDAYRDALASGHDALADPVAHSLYADAFQDSRLVEEAWTETTRRDVAPWERRLERVLAIAGPVPWPLKSALFHELVDDPPWHPPIFTALAGSTFEDEGGLERTAAARLLDRLTLPPDTDDLLALRAHLALP